MHEQDLKLINHATEYTLGRKRSKITQTRVDRLDDAIQEYRTACCLASGPDEKRATVWSETAAVRRLKLERELGYAARAAR